MRPLTEIRGLKYPDEYVVRWVFKRGLHAAPGRVLELGCGTGNNLALLAAYGWRTTGVDVDPAALADARFNLGAEAELIEADLGRGAPEAALGPYQALIVANLLCYVPAAAGEALLSALAARLSLGCEVFVRTRLIDDYRYGRGEAVEPRGFRLATPETGEAGAFNRFYTEAELEALVGRTLRLEDTAAFRCRFDNLQAGRFVPGNSDLILWGRTPA